MTADGTITMFHGLNPGASPHAVTVGSDGNLWFADPGKTPAIGRIEIGSTPTVTEFSTGLSAGSLPDAIVPGPDGNLWFTDIGTITPAVGRITTDGTITEFSTGLNPGGSPRGITPGPDGNLWFTDQKTGAIGRITTGGAITEYSAGLNPGTVPFRITTGPDGNLWFSDSGTTKAIGRFGVGAPAALVTPAAVAGGGAEGVAQSCGGVTWSSWANTQPSSSLFPFDGFQWFLDGTAISGATTATYTPGVGDLGHDLSCRLTVTYPMLNVTEQTTSATVAVRDLSAPVLALPTPAHGRCDRPLGSASRLQRNRHRQRRRAPGRLVHACLRGDLPDRQDDRALQLHRRGGQPRNRIVPRHRPRGGRAARRAPGLAPRRMRHAAGLELKIELARTFLAIGQRRLACLTLTAFAAEVRTESGRTIPPGTAATLIASAWRIEDVIGC